jgi:ribonuclease HI
MGNGRKNMIQVYTDGGCSGNPGPGGWAYVIIGGIGNESVLAENWGAEKSTTNNRMELMAVISALRALNGNPELIPESRQLSIYTDSQYVQKGITEWINVWKRNSWRTRDKKPVKNQDLWQQLDGLAAEFTISWKWVKGHAGNEYNERCDAFTQRAIASL